jgi:hypothetical protein
MAARIAPMAPYAIRLPAPSALEAHEEKKSYFNSLTNGNWRGTTRGFF